MVTERSKQAFGVELKEWCRTDPEVVVDIGGSGAKCYFGALKIYDCLGRGRVLMTGNAGLCAK